jgi:hypothetical protein
MRIFGNPTSFSYRLRERFGSRHNSLISQRIPPQAQFEEDGALVRLEDDLRLATFARGPPDPATVIAPALTFLSPALGIQAPHGGVLS